MISDVIPSANGNFVEPFYLDGRECYVMLFAYAKGMLISDNGYRYREGAPLEEYFYNTGKALGTIHRLSKEFKPVNRRPEFFDKYNREYIDAIIPNEYDALKKAIGERLDSYRNLPVDAGVYGLVHFDFSDGNYHIDMNNGNITVFDFDNCTYCWYERFALLWNSNNDLKDLSNLKSLKEIELWRINKLEDISFLEKLTNLEIIKLQDLKHITTLPDLSLHMNLQRIFLINTGIDIKSLPDGIKEKVFNWDDR